MATTAHCAYCFECLSASFERRQPPSLAQVEDLWEKYQARGHTPNAGEQEDEQSNAEDDAEMTDVDVEEPSTASAKPAAISGLVNRNTSAGSSSSSLQSTTSTLSNQKSSASAADTPASSTTSLRSGSSRLSLGSRKRQQSRQEYPLFVTWNTISKSGYKSLRGCIGTFEAQPLEDGLRSYALTSAFEDVRFQPIPAHLLPQLSNHVTLLTNFSQPTKDPLDWTLGVHGIRISFSYHGRRYGATYLPDVAPEQGWTKEETLVSLMRKAGWNGSSRDWLKVWRDGKGELVRYEGKQVGLKYDEWRAWKDWVEKEGATAKTGD